MAPYKVQIIQDWPEPRKVKMSILPRFANFSVVSFRILRITVPLTLLTRKVHLALSDECRSAFDALKKAFTINSGPYPLDSGHPNTVETDASDYALPLSFRSPHRMASCTRLHSTPRLFAPELNYDVHDKELLAIFEAFKRWRHYLEGSGLPDRCGHRSPELAIFFHDQNPHTSTSTMVRISFRLQLIIRFHPGNSDQTRRTH